MESELVSGFMTEHSAVIFVFFFLAEYASIVLICILTSILFLGGYNLDIDFITWLFDLVNSVIIFIVDLYVFGFKAIAVFVNNISNTSWSETLALIQNIEVYNKDSYQENTELLQAVNRVLGISNEANDNFDRHNGIHKDFLSDSRIEGTLYSLSLGIKSFLMIFTFIWARASFPRIRFDQLMSYCWTVLLPLVFAFVLLIPCILYIFEIIPSYFLFM